MKGRIICVGTFDGVHLGHKALLNELQEQGDRLGLQALVISFSPNPISILAPEQPRAFLNSSREKLSNLEALGFEVKLLSFDRALAKLTAEDFMLKLKEEYNAKAILMGYDHRFGREHEENLSFYQSIGEKLGIQVFRSKALNLDGLTISSSLIRELLRTTKLTEANKLLGYPYQITGTVQGGMHIGRTLGYPTANILLEDKDKLLPADGVYAVKVYLEEVCYDGMLYIGKRPTIDKGLARTIEVNIFDLTANLYAKEISLELQAYIRGEAKFASLNELKDQISKDEVAVRSMLRNQVRTLTADASGIGH